jgi:Protein of unknown function (DUF3179)
MKTLLFSITILVASVSVAAAQPPVVIPKPDAFGTLVNPKCSHCRDEAARRTDFLKGENERALCWIRGYSDGGAIPIRFFLSAHRVISDSYGVFVYDPDAGYARGFAPSYDFRFHGWRNGVMVMKHVDGTLYSCLSGLAFDGPRKGARLSSVPTIVTNWDDWLKHYPQAVAYQMTDKFKPVELPPGDNPDSVRSRGVPDPRLRSEERIFGVWTGSAARAYPLADLARSGMITDQIGGTPLVVLWEPTTKTPAAYQQIASQPRKFKGPAPDAHGISQPDNGEPQPPGTPVVPPRKVTLSLGSISGQFVDAETKSVWDITGRCVDGKLKGWTLTPVDGVRVKWFAWATEYPETSIDRGKE